MKKLLVMLLAVVCCISCIGCANNETEVHTKGRWYYDELENAIEYVRENAKYPESVEITNVLIYADGENTSEKVKNGTACMDFYIEYSADNDFGNSQTGYATYYLNPSVYYKDLDYKSYEVIYKQAHGRGEDFTESSKGYYVRKESGSAVFEVDLQDYVNEGYYLP